MLTHVMPLQCTTPSLAESQVVEVKCVTVCLVLHFVRQLLDLPWNVPFRLSPGSSKARIITFRTHVRVCRNARVALDTPFGRDDFIEQCLLHVHVSMFVVVLHIPGPPSYHYLLIKIFQLNLVTSASL